MKAEYKAMLELGYSLFETIEQNEVNRELIVIHSYNYDEDGLMNVTGIDFSDFFQKNSGVTEIQAFNANILKQMQNSPINSWKFSKNVKFTIYC